MAVEVPISGGPETAKIRNEWGVAGLTVITLGIYGLVWWYKINREMADLGRKGGTTELGTNPTLSLLALFPGAILIVPAIWTIITTYGRAKKSQEFVGVADHQQMNGAIYALFWVAGFFVPFVNLGAYIYLQDGLNKVWKLNSGYVEFGAVAAPQTFSPGAPTGPPAPPQPPAPPAPPAPPSTPEPPAPPPPPSA